MSILELHNVSYQYEENSKSVLNQVDLRFEQGKLTAIMGKSGSGKTTLLSLISGLDLPTGGDILWNGRNLREINRDEYRAKGIGVVFQVYNLLTNATALENILLSMNISKSREPNQKRYALALLQKVGIDEETAGRKILKLSGGEQQRVGIARALSHQPDIVIADEPTGNLDSETEEGILNILQSLAHDQNKCVIVVTHSTKVARCADEIIQFSSVNLKKKGNDTCLN